MKSASVLLISTLAAASFASAKQAPDKPRPAIEAIPESKEYHLKGFFGSGEETEIALTNNDGEDSGWIRVGTKKGSVRVEEASAETGSAIIRVDGKRWRVNLAKPSDGAGKAKSARANASDAAYAALPRQEKEKIKKAVWEYLARLTPEQKKAMNKAIAEKMKANRDKMADGRPKPDPEEMKALVAKARAEGREGPVVISSSDTVLEKTSPDSKHGHLFYAMAEGLEIAAKVPGADGEIRPLPEYFAQALKEDVKISVTDKVIASDKNEHVEHLSDEHDVDMDTTIIESGTGTADDPIIRSKVITR